MSYRNERFKRGNKLTLYYNPYIVTDAGVFSNALVDMGTYEEISYYYADAEYPSADDIITCSSFGGVCTSAAGGIRGTGLSSYSADYSPEYNEDASIRSFAINGATIKVPYDCFANRESNYMLFDRDKIYAFKPTVNFIDDVYISEYISSSEYGKYGQYGINYRVNPDDRIKVIVPERNFDTMCQVLMSESVALYSCDDTYSPFLTLISGYNYIYPYGGGSLNPIVRQGVVITNSIEHKRGINSYELEIKLLG